MNPVSTGRSPFRPATTVRACPPRRGAASIKVTACSDARRYAAPMPEMPAPITAIRRGAEAVVSNGTPVSLFRSMPLAVTNRVTARKRRQIKEISFDPNYAFGRKGNMLLSKRPRRPDG